MQSAVAAGSAGFDRRWATKLFSGHRVLLEVLLRISRRLSSESLEARLGRAVDQAFAEFAKEMRR